MRIKSLPYSLLLIGFIFSFMGCSSNISNNSSAPKASLSIFTASEVGPVKNNSLKFLLYLTNKIESKDKIQEIYGANVFIVHTGHLLKAAATKEENEAVLKSLEGKGIDVINLSLEDFIIADQQQIALETYPQIFLNSSVVNLNEDNIITKSNISSYINHEGVTLIGLSDKVVNNNLVTDKFLISDYVLTILRAKKAAIKNISANKTSPPAVQTFVIIHTIGSEINDTIERLPPNF